MFNIRNIKWSNYMVAFGLAVFVFILIFGNYKSPDFYAKIKAAKREMLKNESHSQPVQHVRMVDIKPANCENKRCVITCSGDMTTLKSFLESQKTCNSISLRISDGIFPDEKLQSNWLSGRFNLSSIKISESQLKVIENGAFNHITIENVLDLELNGVQIMNLSEQTFVGLRSIETFTLVNKIETFIGEAFLKSMAKTLKKLIIRHETDIATDPALWLRGENFLKLATIVFDGSNFGGYINTETFQHLKQLSILMMKSCQIDRIADGTFDFMMHHLVVHISLNGNKLKRIDGEYLSKISVLKRLDIQNNPWNCTCALEHLVREFKAYPQGFGENASCSTPPKEKRKLLNEIDLGPCDEELVPLPTTTKATDPTTSTSTRKTSTTDMLTTTSISPTTTPLSQNRTTTIPADTIFIECARNFSGFLSDILEVAIPDGHFKVVPISDTSARLIFKGISDDLAVVWFHGLEPNSKLIVKRETLDVVGCQSELDKSLVVEGLAMNTTYTFCLIKTGTKSTSPFNCRSYFSSLQETLNHNNTIWLGEKDRPLVIGVFVISVLVSLCIGLAAMFLLIMYHPYLLKGNKRILFVSKSPKKDRISVRRTNEHFGSGSSIGNRIVSQLTTAPLRRFSSDSGLSYMMANNYEVLDYHSIMNIYNRVPKSPAPRPPLPKRISDDERNQPSNVDATISVVQEGVYDYGYTSI